jgi:hypothetical protein
MPTREDADVARRVKLEHVGNDLEDQPPLRIGRGHASLEEGLDLSNMPLHVRTRGDQVTLQILTGGSEQHRERQRAAYELRGW